MPREIDRDRARDREREREGKAGRGSCNNASNEEYPWNAKDQALGLLAVHLVGRAFEPCRIVRELLQRMVSLDA